MSETQIIEAEIREIREVIRNECWLEGERRGTGVRADDDCIRERVADLILNGLGREWRIRYSRS